MSRKNTENARLAPNLDFALRIYLQTIQKLQTLQFSEGTILHVCFTSKIDIRKTSTEADSGFLIDFCVFSQNRAISLIMCKIY